MPPSRDFRTEFSADVIEWSEELADIMGLTVLGVDLFSPDNIDSGSENFSILEINGNPFLKTIYKNGYSRAAIDVWKQLLSKRFNLVLTSDLEDEELLASSG